jgi:ATP-dependent helicase/nuclease subunit B
LETALPTGWSRYWSYYLSKEGDPYGHFENSSALKPEQFERMRQYTRTLIGTLAERLLHGEIQVQPYRLKRQSPCAHCDYRALCKFDWQVNDYHPLQAMSKSEALAQLEGGHG